MVAKAINKSYILGAIIGVAVMQEAHGTQVGFSAFGAARTVVDSAATTIGTSALVWVGNFTSEGFGLNNALSLQDNVTAIQSAGGWKQFGLDTNTGDPNLGVTGSLGINGSGQLFNSIADTSTGPTKADYFNAENLYVWIFNAGTVASSSEMGIFRAPAANTPWVFPTNFGGVGDTTTYSTNNSLTGVITAIGTGGGIGSSTDTQLQLTGIAPVPEPSMVAVGAMLAMTAMGVRRRRRG